MEVLKSTFKRWNGSTWDIHFFRTSADIIEETESYKIMTLGERTAIANYLNTFNETDKLLKLDETGKIPVGLIPGGLNYLTISNPAFTGTLKGKFQEGIWAPDSSLYKLSSHNAGASGSGTPGSIEFTAGQGENVELILTANSIKINSATTVDFSGKNIVNLATPTASAHAATKGYIDGLIATGTKPVDPVKAATTEPITLSGLQKIDGHTTIAGDRILVKDQETASENGIYTASATDWSKVTADSTEGRLTFVEHGSINNDSQFYATSNTSWSLFSRVDTIDVISAGGLEKVGTNLGIKTGGVTNSMLYGGIAYNKLNDTAISDGLSVWTDPSFGTANSANTLTVWLQSALSAIKNLRGTTSYKTNNSETIAGAYASAKVKNRTYVGSGNPATTGYETGDLYLQDIPATP